MGWGCDEGCDEGWDGDVMKGGMRDGLSIMKRDGMWDGMEI